jgi:hypothetical protein
MAGASAQRIAMHVHGLTMGRSEAVNTVAREGVCAPADSANSLPAVRCGAADYEATDRRANRRHVA